MLPSCKVCNNIKGKKELKINYSYVIYRDSSSSFGKIKFKTTFDKNYDINYISGKSLNFNIEIKARYEVLKEEVRDIILKSQVYRTNHMKELRNCWSNLGITEKEMKESLFGYSKII